jgi:hypothetical protein
LTSDLSGQGNKTNLPTPPMSIVLDDKGGKQRLIPLRRSCSPRWLRCQKRGRCSVAVTACRARSPPTARVADGVRRLARIRQRIDVARIATPLRNSHLRRLQRPQSHPRTPRPLITHHDRVVRAMVTTSGCRCRSCHRVEVTGSPIPAVDLTNKQAEEPAAEM